MVLGVSGGGLGLDARLYQIIQLPVFLLIARPGQLVHKGGQLAGVLHLFGIVDDQAALPVAQPLPVLLHEVD